MTHETSLTCSSVFYVHTDVTDWSAQVQAFKTTMANSPSKDRIDGVLAAAGVLDQPFFLPSDEPVSLEKDPTPPNIAPLAVNVIGVMYTLKLAQLYMSLPSSTDSRHASKFFLFFTSPEGHITVPLSVLYGSSKHAVRGIFKISRTPFSSLGIRVNSITPYLVKTPLNAELGPILHSVGIEFRAIEDHTKVAMRLISDESICGLYRCLTVEQAD